MLRWVTSRTLTSVFDQLASNSFCKLRTHGRSPSLRRAPARPLTYHAVHRMFEAGVPESGLAAPVQQFFPALLDSVNPP